MNVIHRLGYRFRHPLPRLRRRLRLAVLRLLGARIEGTPIIAPGVELPWPHTVAIGDEAIISTGVFFDVNAPGPASDLPRITIGTKAWIGHSVHFNAHAPIHIGASTAIAAGCKFVSFSHGMCLGIPYEDQVNTLRPIIVGKCVWLGVNVVVLCGVEIGDGAVVGAGSLVNKSIPANEVWGGVPARRLGRRTAEGWERMP